MEGEGTLQSTVGIHGLAMSLHGDKPQAIYISYRSTNTSIRRYEEKI